MDLSYQFSPNDKLNGICHRGTEVTENPAFEFLYDLYDLYDLCDLYPEFCIKRVKNTASA